jgi:site-specific recombinase XerD
VPQVPIKRRARPLDRDRLVEENRDPTYWEAAVEAFLREKRRANCSEGTLENYRHHLSGPRTRSFLADAGVRTVDQMTADRLRRFEAELREAGCAPGTIGTYHRILKNFLGFARDEGLGVVPDVLRVTGPRMPQKAPGTISEKEEQVLQNAAPSERDRFLIRFLIRTGLRVEELANVLVSDIRDGPDGSYLLVRQGKGAKDRVVPLDGRTVRFSKEIRRYLRDVRPTDSDSDSLFLTNRAPQGTYSALQRTSIQTMLQRLELRTGIKCNPHRFRHTFATRAIQAGIPPLAVQRALGHTTMNMVSRYVHYDPSSLIAAWKDS